MTRWLSVLLTAVAGIVCAGMTSHPAGPEPAVSLLLDKVSAERQVQETVFQCEVALDNATGRELAVRSHFFSAFDGLEIVVTTPGGKVLTQQGYANHQSPLSAEARAFPLKQGKTTRALGFPIRGLPGDVRTLKVRLQGTLPGSGYDRMMSSETLVVEVKPAAGR